METLTLSENEVTTLRGALEVARERYREHAETLRAEPSSPHQIRLAVQFERQADEASALIERLDE